jgi:hypothetical protein
MTGGTSGVCDHFDWWSDASGVPPSKTSEQIVAGVPIALSNGLYVEFTNCEGHSANSSWSFVAVSTSAEAPSAVSITSTTVRDGSVSFGDIPYAAAVAYKRESNGFVEAYRTPLTYRIEEQSVEIFELTTKNPSPQSDLDFAFTITMNGVTTVTDCVSWNSYDNELEDMLSLPSNGLCAADDDNCITVTRGVDQLNNPGGFVFSIYYESATLASNISDSTIAINSTAGCSSTYDFSSHVIMSKQADGA